MLISPLQLITAHARHIKSEVAMGIMSLEDACQAHLGDLLNVLRQSKDIEMSAATEAYEHLGETTDTFNSDQRKEIANTIRACLKSASAAKARSNGSGAQCRHDFIEHYLTDKLWTILMSRDSVKNKMRVLVTFLMKTLGMRHVHESVKTRCVSIIHVSSDIDCSPQQGYDDTCTITEIWQQLRSSIECGTTLAVFPATAEEFVAQYPNAYPENEPPVPCRIDVGIIRQRTHKDVTPARSTNKRVSSKRYSPTRAVAHVRPSEPLVHQSPSFVAHSPPQNSMNAMMETLRADMHTQMKMFMEGLRAQPPPPSGTLVPLTDAGGSAAPDQSDTHVGVPPPGCLAPFAGATTSPKKTEALGKLELDIRRSCTEANQKKKKNRKDTTGDTDGSDDDEGDDSDGEKQKARKKTKKTKGTKHKADESGDGDDASTSEKPKKKHKSGKDGSSKHKKDHKTKDKKDKKDKPRTKDTSDDRASAKKKRRDHGDDTVKPVAGSRDGRGLRGLSPDSRAKQLRRLMKRPARADRPRPSKEPTVWLRGKIYFSKAKKAYRVYRRLPDDKVEETVPVDISDKSDKKAKWGACCALIESDPRL